MSRLFALACGLSLLVGCSRDDVGGGISPDGVMVLFSAEGLDLTIGTTRASTPLTKGTTLRVVAFRRANAATPAVTTGTPDYRNTYIVADAGSLIPSLVDGNGGTAAGTATQMRIATSGVYDFYAYANALPFIPGATNVTDITHGMDFLVGSSTGVSVGISAQSVQVVFSGMEHLCTKIDFTLKPEAANTVLVTLSVNSVTMSGIATAPATFSLGSAAVVPLTQTGGTYTIPGTSFVNSDAKTSSGSGIMLSSTPASTGIDIAFNVDINGSPITLKATGITAIGQFIKGSRYPFTLSIGQTRLTLLLNISDDGSLPLWNDITWGAEIGSGNSIILGSWDVASWNSSMGGQVN